MLKKNKGKFENLPETNEDWLLKSDDLEEKEIENIVSRDSRKLGLSVSSDIPVNIVPQLDLSFKDQRSLNKHLTEQTKQEEKNLSKTQELNDALAERYIAIRSMLYNTLDRQLTKDNKLLIDIDVMFEEFMPDLLEELRMSYDIIEYKRNEDALKLDPTIPLRYCFMMK